MKIVITGTGTLSPIGKTPEEMWENCLKGKSGAADTTDVVGVDPELWKKTSVKTVCPVPNYNPLDYFTKKMSKRLSNHQQFGVITSEQAITQSGIMEWEGRDPSRISVITAGGCNGTDVFCQQSLDWNTQSKKFNPTDFLKVIPNTTAFWVSHRNGFTGPNWHHVSACASGAQAIVSGINSILLGDSDVAICTGVESQPHPMPGSIYTGLRALSPECSMEISQKSREAIMKPFDAERTGFVLGGGSGTLLLETEEHALSRGATILGELAGWHINNDAYNLVSPDPSARGIADCMAGALSRAGIKPSQVGYVNAHGTSTKNGDAVEVLGLKKTFGENKSDTILGSTKSMMGHCQGASGSLEAIITMLTIQNQIAPPTINLTSVDPACAGFTFNTQAKNFSSEYAMSNSFGFGGINCSLVFRKY